MTSNDLPRNSLLSAELLPDPRLASFDERRLGLLLHGAVDPMVPQRRTLTRQHYFLYPEELHRPGLERDQPHRGLLSFVVQAPGDPTPYAIVHGRLFDGGFDTGILAIAREEAKEAFFLREGGGGIASFDLQPACRGGCAFCPRTRSGAARRRSWLESATEADAVRAFMLRYERHTLASLDQISIVTGRFANEANFVAHVMALLNAALSHGFQGDLYFASDQLVHPDAMEQVRAAAPRRVYYAVTIESFSRRAALMPTRADVDWRSILEHAKRIFGRAYYNLILGLEPLADVIEGIDALAPVATPYISVFCVYSRAQEAMRAEGANQLVYYQQVQRLLLRRFGREAYMHDAPHFNVSNRALLPYPADRFAPWS